MRKRLKMDDGRPPVPATVSGPRPGDFALGSLHSRAAARALVAAHAQLENWEDYVEFGRLTPLGEATVEDVANPGVRRWLLRLVSVAEERAKLYGQPLPTPEEVRHNRAVKKEIDRITNGDSFSLELRDGLEWNRLKSIAEQNLRDK